MPISPEIVRAVELLHTFRVGDQVAVTNEGREYQMQVTRPARRSDGQFGSVESTNVTVSLGLGRWSTEIRAELLAAGKQSIAKSQLTT